ncbi:MAG: hypothetical protein O2820_20170 [Planctomycetota bacterium]|nr:hypothetical protein [Planctomycetota bacterium]MDA1251531.1 hypothetical protein [Planctomycetota bacterium]
MAHNRTMRSRQNQHSHALLRTGVRMSTACRIFVFALKLERLSEVTLQGLDR